MFRKNSDILLKAGNLLRKHIGKSYSILISLALSTVPVNNPSLNNYRNRDLRRHAEAFARLCPECRSQILHKLWSSHYISGNPELEKKWRNWVSRSSELPISEQRIGYLFLASQSINDTWGSIFGKNLSKKKSQPEDITKNTLKILRNLVGYRDPEPQAELKDHLLEQGLQVLYGIQNACEQNHGKEKNLVKDN